MSNPYLANLSSQNVQKETTMRQVFPGKMPYEELGSIPFVAPLSNYE